MNPFQLPSPLQKVRFSPLSDRGIELFVKRDDLIHPDISGNKWRKLSDNIAQAQRKNHDALLTFGGAHSNHIAATAAAGKHFGFNTIGIIRGEEADLENPTLSFARGQGMKIVRVSRAEYRDNESRDYTESLREVHGRFFLIPQGGANFYGVNGCMKIMPELDIDYQRVFVACGTGTTLSGMALSNRKSAKIYGVSALKGGGFLKNELEKWLHQFLKDEETEADLAENVHFLLDHHFGGYAKIKPELIDFLRLFYRETGIKLDPIYNGKAAFAMSEMASSGPDFSGEKWILIHSGGLQGISAMEEKLGSRIYPNC
jgi:1-aminocyclopropane-1-carboxylate deaminase/D-cysteine desulfhydrase-like pyridoxal-dependent ACC family enzyme